MPHDSVQGPIPDGPSKPNGSDEYSSDPFGKYLAMTGRVTRRGEYHVTWERGGEVDVLAGVCP